MDELFEKFRHQPFISTIADNPKWTISTAKKVPIDMFTFMLEQRVQGAQFTNENSLVSLDTVNEYIPMAPNYAYYLDALIDKFVVLDIEPACPNDIKQKLLALPCLYCEESMSGKGVHMVFRLPEEVLNEYPDARSKVAFKEEHKYYEILLMHYVTFTGRQLPATIADDNTKFTEIFRQLAAQQKLIVKANIEIERLENVDTKYSTRILDALRNHANIYTKTLEKDFHGDVSRYEFAYLAYLYKALKRILSINIIAIDHNYTDSEKAWFLYTIATEKLPKRAKHEEYRNQLPWLQYLAFEVISKIEGANEKPKS